MKDKKIENRIAKLKKAIVPILKKNKIIKAGVFDSFVRGDYKKNSDIDVLIKYPKGLGFGFAGIQLDLEEKLGRKVHLVTYRSIHPKLKEQILKEEIRIL